MVVHNQPHYYVTASNQAFWSLRSALQSYPPVECLDWGGSPLIEYVISLGAAAV